MKKIIKLLVLGIVLMLTSCSFENEEEKTGVAIIKIQQNYLMHLMIMQ